MGADDIARDQARGRARDQARDQDRRWAELVERRPGGAGESPAGESAAGGTGSEGANGPDPFDEDWSAWREIFEGRPGEAGPPVAWTPSAEITAESNPGRLQARLGLGSWQELHSWSCRRRAEYWQTAIGELDLAFAEPPAEVLDDAGGPLDPRWLPGARFNLAASCWRAPAERPAIVVGREGSDELETVTYGELRRRVDRLAGGLAAIGVRPGEAVGLYLPLGADCVAAYLALATLGARAVPVAESFPARELAKRLEIGGAKRLLTRNAFTRGGRRIDLYAEVRAAGVAEAVVRTGEGEEAPDLDSGHRRWDEVAAAGTDGAVEPEPGPADRVLNVLFSSGTTGTPKAIPWTHATPIKGAADGRYHQDVRPGDVVAWPTSIGWMMGPWLIWASLLNRATIALFDGAPTGRGFTGFVGRSGVTVLGVVPSLVRAWRERGAVGWDEWPRVRVLSSTGEPSNAADVLWLMSRTGYRAPMIEYCGGTEIGGGFLTGSVTRPASPACFSTPALGLDVALLGGAPDDRRRRPVPEGDAGELFIVPPSIGLSQTLLNADHEAQYHEGCPEGPGGEPLRRHGDRIERLPGGFFRARGRTDDTMNLGGVKVASVEIEQALAGHPAVAECAAAAVPDPDSGADRLVVWVVPAGDGGGGTDAGEPDAETLRGELSRRLARELNPLFRVADVVPIRSLPRTASNKLMRRKLRESYGGG